MGKFSEACDWVEKLASEAQFFREKKKPSLENVHKILDLLGRPDNSFDWRVVVTGTAGKGTVCTRTARTLEALGKKVCLLTSPHIHDVRERIEINGVKISEDLFGECIGEVKNAQEQAQGLPLQVTYYEVIVVAGILAGMKSGSEILICEVGLGGEFDAVNAVKGKRIAALTFIGNDHRDILGDLPDIAKTKSGIFTNDTQYAFSYEKKFRNILDAKCPVKINYLTGIKQKLNKKITRKICEKILGHTNFFVAEVAMMCRWEKIHNFILDGAHSGPRFEFIEKKVAKVFGGENFSIAILGMAENHDPESFRGILGNFDEIIWTKISNDRPFHEPEFLKDKFERGIVTGNIEEALEILTEFSLEKNPPRSPFNKGDDSRKPIKVFVSGSFYLCAEVRERVLG